MTLVTLRAEWYTDASADLNLVMPSVRSRLEAGWHGDFVSSTGPWPEEGHWESAQAFSLPVDEIGRRFRSADNYADLHASELCISKHCHFQFLFLISF